MNLRQRIADRARSARLRDGTRVFLRPLRETDLSHAQEYFASLSEQSRYLRFMIPTPTLTAETLAQAAKTLHEVGAAITVAVVDHGDREELIGGARVVPTDRRGIAEFAVSLADAWQGRGIGAVLLREVVRLGRALGYHHVEGLVLTQNTRMLTVARRARFRVQPDHRDLSVTIVSRALHP
ncbi:MAG: GNAT family protein [Pseudomonadota bacterium]|nr:GNAT family protein [Pseudomonadota bacterium]